MGIFQIQHPEFGMAFVLFSVGGAHGVDHLAGIR